jgi:serine/threonine protein kinase
MASFLSFSELSDQDKLAYEKELSNTGVIAELRGIVMGHGNDSPRLIVRDASGDSIIRMSDPSLINRIDRSVDLEKHLLKLKEFGGSNLLPPVSFGLSIRGRGAGRQFWVKRPYYPFTLHTITSDPRRMQISNTIQETSLAHVRELISLGELTKQLLAFLSFLHSQGLIHGNLKLENIAFETQSKTNFVVLDTGLRIRSLVKTPELSPEILQGGLATEASDVYSLAPFLTFLPAYDPAQPQQQNLFSKIKSEDPFDRPSLYGIAKFYSISLHPGEQSSFLEHVAQKEVVQTNSLIDIENQLDDSSPLATTFVDKDSIPSIPNQSAITTPKNFILTSLIGLAIASSVGIILFSYRYFSNQDSRQVASQIPLKAYWESGQLPLMRAVVQASISEQREEAQRVLLNSSADKKKIIDLDMLKRLTESQWYSQFNQYDKAVYLSYALDTFTPELKFEILSSGLEKLHPAIIYLIAIHRDDIGALNVYDATNLIKLSGGLGEAISALLGQEKLTLKSPVLRAFLNVLSGKKGSARVYLFHSLGSNSRVPKQAKNKEQLIKRVTALIKSASVIKKDIYDAVLEELKKTPSHYTPLLYWFKEDVLEIWNKISSIEILFLLNGVIPQDLEDFENLIDLTQYPLNTVRQSAILKTANILQSGPYTAKIVDFLKVYAKRFRREQIITLLALIKESKGQDQKQQIQDMKDWLSTDPDPRGVAEFTVAFSFREDLADINLAIAKYLSSRKKPLLLPFETIRKLVIHPEPLVRVVAYSLLNPIKNNERQILEQASSVEPDSSLKTQLLARLEASKRLLK